MDFKTQNYTPGKPAQPAKASPQPQQNSPEPVTKVKPQPTPTPVPRKPLPRPNKWRSSRTTFLRCKNRRPPANRSRSSADASAGHEGIDPAEKRESGYQPQKQQTQIAGSISNAAAAGRERARHAAGPLPKTGGRRRRLALVLLHRTENGFDNHRRGPY